MENTNVDSQSSYNNVEMSAEQKFSSPPGYPSQDAGYRNANQSGYPAYYPSAHVQHPVVVSAQPVATLLPYQQPNDNLGLSICSMFCCFFIGIFALLKAINSRDLYRCGNHVEAQRSGQSAQKIAIAAIVVGCTVIGLNILIVIVTNAVAASETGDQGQGQG